jgi:FMN phosphatase YigB (HAD superfamily)
MKPVKFGNKKALLLDMNKTFMFGEDKFGETEDFSISYKERGGTLEDNIINQIVRSAYNYLDARYPKIEYQNNFPTLEKAINETSGFDINNREMKIIIDTFSFHEIGHIPNEYKAALYQLSQFFRLAVVIDIWAPKDDWLELFNKVGIINLFEAMSFSSDHRMVKPSPKPYQNILDKLKISSDEAIVIGDSPRRDLGGAKAAGIDCILVGGENHPDAIGNYNNLLDFCLECIVC